MTATLTAAAPARDAEAGPAERSTVTPRRSFALAVAVALVVGLALRVAISLTDETPSTDETAYLRSGISLVEGDGFVRGQRPELHFPPLVPVLLGLASRAFSDPHTGTLVLAALSSAALVIPLAALGRRVAGRAAGVATAWLAALAPGLSTTLVIRGGGAEAEYTLLLVSALALVVSAADRRGRARHALFGLAGLMVGLAYLTRPEGLFATVPLGFATLFLAARGLDDARSQAGAALRAAAAFLVPILACVVPYVSYLHDHTGEWQLSAKTQDASIEAWEALARNDRGSRDAVLYALDRTGLELSAEPSSLPSLALDDPAGYAEIVGHNVVALAELVVLPDAERSLAWDLLPAPLWLLVGLGAWRHRQSRVTWLVVAIGLLPVVTALVFFVQVRYLMSMVAPATVLAGAGVTTLAERRRPQVLAGAVALVALSSALAFWGPGGRWASHSSDATSDRRAGEWLAAHAGPEDRVMTRSMVLAYYAERPVVATPYADLGDILRFGRYYGTRYVAVSSSTAYRLRPQLRPLLELDDLPGLHLVHEVSADGRTTRVFEVRPIPPADRPEGPSLGFVGDG